MQGSFLADLAATLCARYGHSELSRVTVVLPNGKACDVLRRCVAAHSPLPSGTPQVLSIEAFLQQCSPLQLASPLQLVHALYQTLRTLQPQQEPFERFYVWGSRLVEDFDVMDKYLVCAEHLFADLRHQKALSASYDYLTEEQRAVIQSFWKHFEERLSAHQQDFLRLWKLLPRVYLSFRQRLQSQGMGYAGLCHQAAHEALVQGGVQLGPMVFAGFNALTPTEEQILAWCHAHVPTEFYWDVDAYYMDSAHQEAGTYLRAHKQKPHFRGSFVQPWPARLFRKEQTIRVTAVASAVGQAQVVAAQLRQLMEAQGAAFVPSRTAVVVADEALRLPVLHALPLRADQICTTLGHPLRDTAVYRLLEHWLALQLAASDGCVATGRVLSVLRHPHVQACAPTAVQTTMLRLQARASSHVALADLVAEHTLYAKLFKPLAPQQALLPRLTELLEALTVVHAPLEQQALQRLLQLLSTLPTVLGAAVTLSDDFVQLLRQLVQASRLVPDQQSPEGVQVLEVLATQNLDFDYVFVVGMNEGHFPAEASAGSYLPHSLRRGYGLPTADQHQAALYTYLFYRLLQRAQQAYVTYSTQDAAEVSRYVWQLQYEAPLPLQQHTMAQPIHLTTIPPIVVHKKGLQQWVPQPLSASALNTYLDCSLRFYFQYVAKLKAPPPPHRATNALVFGTLLHEVMEALYAPLVQKRLQPADWAALHKAVVPTVQAAFARTFRTELQGDTAIAQAVLTKLVTRLVAWDEARAPWTLVGLEEAVSTDFAVDATTRVPLRGIIDRIDCQDGVHHVLDYKTGQDNKRIKNMAALFDPEAPGRNRAAFQAFFYAWLFWQHAERSAPGTTVVPGLLNTRELFDDGFDPRFFIQMPNSRTYAPVDAIVPHQAAWEQGLRQTLTTLLDPAVPFVQTPDEARCSTCPYRGICQRH